MPIPSPATSRPRFARILLLAAALTTLGGCAWTAAGRAAADPRPGLADVRVLGPKGQKCFDFCAQSEASCKGMCPGGTHGECDLDCEADSRECLTDCPELQRPVSPKN